MKQEGKKQRIGRPSPAMVVAIIALIVALTGSAYAAFKVPRNSVGTRQLQAKSVTAGKLADGTITGDKIAEGTVTGQNIDMGALGTVPQAANAAVAAEALQLDKHEASCPEGTTLIRGVCFDASPNPPAESPQEAADACATKGGWLPSPLELYSVRGVLNLGTGIGSDNRFTDEIYANTNGTEYRSVVVNGNGNISEISAEGHIPERYTCVYPLVR